MRPLKTLALALLLLSGCGRLKESSFPTGSQTLITAADGQSLLVVDTDAGLVARYGVDDESVTTVLVGSEPSRLARSGNRVFVTLRGERAIAVLEDREGVLVLQKKVSTGAEPIGIVAGENGTRVFVALSLEDEVHELDGTSLKVLRKWTVPGQPSWLALHPSGRSLFVGSAIGGHLTWIDLKAGVAKQLDLPEHSGRENVSLTRRVTGDPWISADGRKLAVPALYVDNTTVVEEPGEEGATRSNSGYASTGMALSVVNPGVVLVPLDRTGKPKMSDAATVFVADFSKMQNNARGTVAVRSYLSSVTMSPDGLLMLATMEASQTVVALSTVPIFPNQSLCDFCGSFDSGFEGGRVPFADTGVQVSTIGDSGVVEDTASFKDTGFFFDTGRFSTTSPQEGGFAKSPTVFIGTDAGPRGAAFTRDGRAFVHSFLDHTVAPVNQAKLRTSIENQFERGETLSMTYKVERGVQVAAPSLDYAVETGRRLFYSAINSSMAAAGAGISCSTCHFDGRNDGMTWALEHGGRQTPSLAGKVSLTTPVTWTDNVESAMAEAEITSAGPMGGEGLDETQSLQIGAYIDWIRDADVPLKGSDSPAVLRGQEIFERPDVGCAECHSGPLYTDNESHDMLGLTGVNTPTLIGIAATAPFLHDGSAATLRALLEGAAAGAMGDTSDLSVLELDDLEAFLGSL
jgi:DNA-binding beta-propeller fold protein YncE